MAEEEGLALLERFDGYAGLRNGLREVAASRDDYAGIPMPLDGRCLVIEPTYPNAKALCDIGVTELQRDRAKEIEAANVGYTIRNRFWSFNKRAWIVVFQRPDGKVEHFKDRGPHVVDRLIDTMDCSRAWGIEQEATAVQTLGSLVRHHQFKTYLLTGMFIERSKRSKLLYIFRRLRPTLVLDTSTGNGRVRCALCLHPIGYYEGTWAGAMCPTDDLIAHLMMMRGDEPLLWRRANQHPPWEPNAGVM